MDSQRNYSNQSMNEIVFESRNKEYGAFLHRTQYQKYLAKALAWSIGIFVLSVVTPLVIKKMGWIKEQPVPVLDTFTLMQPPPLNPKAQEKPEVPKLEETRQAKDLELDAAKKEDVQDSVPLTNDKKKNDPSKTGSDTSGKSNVNGDGDNNIYSGRSLNTWPQFPGGEEAYFKFLTDHLKYPKEEEQDAIGGRVEVSFVVNKDGSLEQFNIRKSSGNENLDQEALRLMKMQPHYIPGTRQGKPVRAVIIIPVTFNP